MPNCSLDSLCQELDQERKARFTLQQKLKGKFICVRCIVSHIHVILSVKMLHAEKMVIRKQPLPTVYSNIYVEYQASKGTDGPQLNVDMHVPLCYSTISLHLPNDVISFAISEAHDALHSFSCKMLASRQCAECAYKEQNLPR